MRSGLSQELVTHLVSHAVVVLVLLVDCYGVAGRIVKDYDVVELHVTESLHAAIFPVGLFKVALAVEDGQRVLRQRHGQRGLRNARTIGELGNQKVVTRQQRFL